MFSEKSPGGNKTLDVNKRKDRSQGHSFLELICWSDTLAVQPLGIKPNGSDLFLMTGMQANPNNSLINSPC